MKIAQYKKYVHAKDKAVIQSDYSKTMSSHSLKEYLQNNKDVIQSISLLVALFITIGGTCVRFFCYLWHLGYAWYFDIPSNQIDVSNENIIYSVLTYGVVALIYAAINYFFFRLWMCKRHLIVKIMVTLGLIIGLPFLWVCGLVIRHDPENFVESFIICIDLWLLLIAFAALCIVLGLVFGITSYVYDRIEKRNKIQESNSRNKSNKGNSKNADIIAFTIAIAIIIFSIFSFGLGYNSAKTKYDFIIVEQNDGNETSMYAVIYETDQYTIITPCLVNEENKSIILTDHNNQLVLDNPISKYTYRQDLKLIIE